MTKRISTVLLPYLLLASLLISACSKVAGTSDNQSQPTDLPAIIADTGTIAEGRVVPREAVQLSFNAVGRVAEVFVKVGDVVKAGDVLARLGDREGLEARVAAAELELLAAKQELLNAEQALQALQDNLPDDQTAALQSLTDAQREVRDRNRDYTYLRAPAEQLDIDAAQAQVVLARKALEDAQDDYEPYANKSEDNPVRAVLLNALAAAQRAYEDAVRRYNNLIGASATEFDEQQTAAKLEIAQSRLAIAQDKYNTLLVGPDPDAVALAQSRIDTAKGRISSADASKAAVTAELADLDLIATIDGTVVDLDLIPGQAISAGMPVIELADFSQIYVETDNLTEIEVVAIQEGQNATIVPDAIPEVSLNAVVESIGYKYEEKRGDVTFTVRLLLAEPDPRLRWGMTVSVSFAK